MAGWRFMVESNNILNVYFEESEREREIQLRSVVSCYCSKP